MQRKIQQTMFVWVFELQTPNPELDCKIKTDHFLASKLIHWWTRYDLFDGQEKIETHSLDFVNNLFLNLTYLFYIGIISAACGKFRLFEIHL